MPKIKLINCRQLESAIISHFNNTIKQRPTFFHISPNLADIILHEDNINTENWWEEIL